MTDARKLALGTAIESAAEKLPAGFQIEIDIERGSGSARLVFPNGDVDRAETTDLGLTESIEYFIEVAQKFCSQIVQVHVPCTTDLPEQSVVVESFGGVEQSGSSLGS